VLAAAALIVVAVYLGMASGNAEAYRSRPVTFNHYNLLVDGFLKGHLYMDLAPGPGDDGTYRERLHDTSLYRGHYYLYFGVTPALVLFLPWKVLTGAHLAQYWAAAAFACGGYLASLALLLGLRRDFFPGLSRGVLFVSAVALGLVNWWPFLLARVGMWEVPIASAYCFSALAVLCLYLGTRGPGRPALLACASLCCGLMVGSRPNYLLGTVILLAPVLYFWRAERAAPAGRRAWAARLLALGLPVLGAGALLAAYNLLRFGSPLEFGTRYMLVLFKVPATTFSPSFVGTNLWLYFLAPAHLSPWFPFFKLSALPALPPGFASDPLPEDMYGMLANMPVLLLGLAAPALAAARGAPARLRMAVLALAGLLLGVGGLLMFYYGANGRYTVDAMAGLPVLAVLGIWLVEARVPGPGPLRSLARGLWGALAAYSGLFSACAAVGHDDIFRSVHPGAYRVVARALDLPAHVRDRLDAVPYGPLALTVTFPGGRPGQNEPLVTTGWWPRVNILFVRYTDGTHVQFGFAGGPGTVVGEPVALDYARPHTLRVSMGSLYPPRQSPFFDGLDARDADALSGTLLVELDGVRILRQRAYFFDADRRRPVLGRGPASLGPPGRGWVFTGRLAPE
jgi:hypothetical protein